MQFSTLHSAGPVGRPDAVGIPVVKMGNGFLKAILLDGRETVFGRDVYELLGRLKSRPGVLRVLPKHVEQALERGNK